MSEEREPAPGIAAERRRDLRAGLLLGLLCLVVYNANLRLIGAGDTYPARYLPFVVWRFGSVYLDRISSLAAQGHIAYWIVRGRTGHEISLYPVVLPIVIAPLYLPAVTYLHFAGWTDQRLDRAAQVMEKLTAALIAAATVGLLYLLLRRLAPPRDAIPLAIAFAFGTTTWVIASQALWQHGLGELLITGALLVVTGRCTSGRAVATGLLCGLTACNRPPDAILAAAIGIYALRWAGRRAPLLAAAAAVPVGLVLAYNLEVAGNVAGAYGLRGDASFFAHPLLPGLAGLLLSPTRGLFVFSPFLLAIPLGARTLLRQRAFRALTGLLVVAVALQLLLYAKTDWRAGVSWGPRFLTDVLPILLWMLAPIVVASTVAGRRLFLVACGIAIAIEAVGAVWYTGASDLAILDNGPSGHSMRAAWLPQNAPFVAELRHRPAHAELGLAVAGNIDAMESGGREVSAVIAGDELSVVGWSLTGGRSPAAVLVSVDGRMSRQTTSFYARPDVARELRTTSAAGWRVAISTADLRPGAHVVSASARAHAGELLHFIGQCRFTVLANPLAAARPVDTRPGAGPRRTDSLGAAARQAAAFLRAHQQPQGYWLTSYTSTPRFESPHPEMNTYLTAVLVDLLDPVAESAGLDESLRRARSHLTAQIEPNGLVRYHGLPDAPTIGTLGCAITPDADDTALVWRIAPGRSPASLRTALDVLGDYRTSAGLYRTWLAPRDRYQCIDPGKDPNPPDVGIQMHVLLLLAQADPPAARALCEALRRTVADERIWVYYREAPLIPILREADLRKAGCTLHLPEARLATTVPDQEAWVSAARQVARLASPAAAKPDAAETLALLRSLASHDFSALHASPPLLYHNDLTASVRRFYWSEEFGYALWLRLYLENAARR